MIGLTVGLAQDALYSCTHMATVGVKGLKVVHKTHRLRRVTMQSRRIGYKHDVTSGGCCCCWCSWRPYWCGQITAGLIWLL